MSVMFKRFFDQTCSACGLRFQPVDWLSWRVRGYCCSGCDPETAKKAENDPQFDLFDEESDGEE
jgi:hypothetical protein